MVWWLFKKRDDEDRWLKLHDSLTNSFQKIKEEIKHTHTKIDGKHEHHSSTIKGLDKRLAKLEKELSLFINSSLKPSINETSEIEPELNRRELLIDNLSTLHKRILFGTIFISRETGSKWVTMRKVFDQCYDKEKYSDKKSTLSTYTDTLVELSLINKKRKGRNTYLTLTAKAIDILPEIERQLDLEKDMDVK